MAKSPKYTRRHFQDVAAMIKELPKSKRAEFARMWSMKFAADNARFDKSKFYKACGA